MSEVRLIDANKMKDHVAFQKDILVSMGMEEIGNILVNMVIDEINIQPTVDAVPVRHGEWLRTEAFPHRIYCSVCYKTYVPNDRWQIWEDDELPKNYCPNCGAKMDGADGERKTE